MLIEIKKVRQIPNEGFRKWFTDKEFDLIIWYEEDIMVGFQLCYGIKNNNERALTWHKGNHYTHNMVDDGESPYTNKMTPILISDGIFNKSEVAENFREHAKEMEYGLVDFIYSKILDYKLIK